MDGFLKFGPIVLVLAIVAFGLFYWFDQRTPQVPSIMTQQVAKAEEAVRDDPNSVPARLALGAMYDYAGRADDAIAQYDEVLKVDAGNKDALLGKGTVLVGKGDLDEAAAVFNTITEADRGGEFAGVDKRLEAAYHQLGLIGLARQEPEKALEEFGHALAINPTDADTLYQSAVALGQLGRHDEAIATVQRALTFVPTEWCEPYQQLASSYTALGQPEKASYAGAMSTGCAGDTTTARAQLEGLVDGPAGAEAAVGLGGMAEVDGDIDAAVGWYRKALEIDPQNMAAMTGLAGLGVAPDGAPTGEPKK